MTRTCEVVDFCSDAETIPDLSRAMESLTGVFQESGVAGGAGITSVAQRPAGSLQMAGMVDMITSCRDLASLPSLITTRVCPVLIEVCTKTCSDLLNKPCTPKVGKLPVVSAGYHAHLLGREMYQHLRPKKGGDVVDLGSQAAWYVCACVCVLYCYYYYCCQYY